ncbi:hypothetical protein GM526_17615 [Enterococcus avium]|uniref:hypothetical protein n=1 Tax=Enterococcus avium TaxID=33945 RepID=UPI00159D52BE|nr:hypothetical protein [Enterococcus avium]NVN78878.1 hypothetical protein [Enterococcus avium]
MADIVQLKENGVGKYMKTHVDAIDGVDGKLVKATGNETILGTKDFKDGLQVDGIAVLSAKSASQTFDSTTTGEIQAGSIKFVRKGPFVIATLNFQVRSDRDITQDQNIFSGLNSNLACDADFTESISTYGGTTALINVQATKMTARTTLVKDTWYIGRIVYEAKN